MKIQEDLLHFIWSMLASQKQALTSTKGLAIEILNGGINNEFEGPDFKEASLKIGDNIWAGSVEIHINSSDWDKHKHSSDSNYANVILHVVYEHDKEVLWADGSEIPVLALNKIISREQLKTYQSLKYNSLAIPCQELLHHVEPIYLNMMLTKAAIDRLTLKSDLLISRVDKLDGDWNTAFYVHLAENFGFKSNAGPMRSLAESIPIQILAKHKDSLQEILALLFGQGGFLNGNMQDEYTVNLQRIYQFLAKKYSLKLMQQLQWKFVKTRPSNYPGIRIAQFANLIFNSSHLFSKIIAEQNIVEIGAKFRVEADEYWRHNYHFNKKRRKPASAAMGSLSTNLILINTVAVCLFAYGQHMEEEALKEKALKLLQALPSEANRVVRRYRLLNFSVTNALESQGCLGLDSYFCKEKKCLSCLIGQNILKRKQPNFL